MRPCFPDERLMVVRLRLWKVFWMNDVLERPPVKREVPDWTKNLFEDDAVKTIWGGDDVFIDEDRNSVLSG